MTLTLEQKIARKEAELQRLKQKKDKLMTRQKIIVGAVMIDEAYNTPPQAQALIEVLESNITRKSDLTAVQPLIDDLQSFIDDELEKLQY